MSENMDRYYQMADDWAEQYLKENTVPKQISIKQGEYITNDLFF